MDGQLDIAPWTPRALVYEMAAAGEPQVSPDGTRLLYALVKADPRRPAEAPRSQLWASRIDGSEPRALTGQGHRDNQPRWSPDGTRIAFCSDRVPGVGIFVMPASGGEPLELTRHEDRIEGLCWSADGTRLAYVVAVSPPSPAQGPGGLVRVTRRMDYKEDGRGYLGEKRLQVHVLDVETGERRQLTDGPRDHRHPNWSPDGRLLAALSFDAVGMRSRLELLDPEERPSATVSLGEAGVVALSAWSPAADRLLLVGEPGRTAQTDIYLYHLGSERLERLTVDLPVLPDAGRPNSVAPSTPVWVDESRVMLHALHGGASGLYLFDVQTRDLEPLTDLQAQCATLSTDRSANLAAQVHSSFESHGEICVFDRRGGEVTVVTRHNAELFAQRPPARAEPFEIRRDGFTIDAWLLYPPDFDPRRRHPMVLDIHGGPHGHHGPGFANVPECLASAGFLVLLANPRGSGTYGRHFATRVIKDWGGEDFLDLMAVVDEALDHRGVDPERLGVHGYSYGGYMTAWMIGQTDRFKAAVCGAPCFNLVSHYGTSDIGPYWGRIQYGARPHEAPEWFRDHSPSTYAHRATTPTLIVQGEADERCPVGQSEEMFAALCEAGCEVELVRYPGASHSFPRAGLPGQREDYLTRVLEWFQGHLV
jgi:dipeptidyl aminopeptidase/acylaminoacyl peptidase